jgi:hypothetical protein
MMPKPFLVQEFLKRLPEISACLIGMDFWPAL